MNVDQYIEIYRRTDISGLNDAVGALEGKHHLDVLTALERRGFEVLWRRDQGKPESGVVMAGPDEKRGLGR